MRQTKLIFLLLMFLIGNVILGYHFYLRFTIDLNELASMDFSKYLEFVSKLKGTLVVGGSLIGGSGLLALIVIPARI